MNEPTIIQVRPSKIDQLKTAASGPVGTLAGTVLAIMVGLLSALQTYQASADTARASYNTLKEATEKNAAQIEVCRKGQIELQVWVQELSDRLERRQKEMSKKVKPAVEPIPKPPVAVVVPESTPLPAFDTLSVHH